MRLDGTDRVQSVAEEKVKKLIEIEPSLTHREMLVSFSVIVVEVNFPQIGAEGFDPAGKRRLPHAK